MDSTSSHGENDGEKTMLACVVNEFNKPWTSQRIPLPQQPLGDHQILIKVAVASFCHTDMMVLEGRFHDQPSGLSGSHEPSGTIVALGSAAADNFSVGDRVIAIGIQEPCGDCVDCNGPEEFRLSCKFNAGYSGISAAGAFQEFTVVDERFTVRIPDGLSFVDAAPLTCAGCTSWRALKRSKVRSGGWLGIVGSGGGLGHLAVQFASKMGIKTVGVEARDVGLESSRKAGATQTIDIRNGLEACLEQVRAAIGPRGDGRGDDLCDGAIILSDAKSAVHTAMALTRGHGTVVMVAQPEKVEFPFEQMIFRDIRIVGSNLSSRDELQELVQFVWHHKMKVESIIYHGLNSVGDLWAVAKTGQVAGKLVVVVDEKQV